MKILKDISIMWSLLHTLVMFLLLFESRYPRKKMLTLTLSAMLPLIAVNFVMFLICGTEGYIQRMLLSLSLPSLIFFWILAKHRDGRFFFTFCMVDTLVLEIIYITNIIYHYIPSYWFMFFVRMVIYPLIEWFMYAKVKDVYHTIQHQVKKGWWIFAFIGLMFYVAITLAMSVPTLITQRPEDMPVFIFLLILMPLSYINIFNALRHQHNAFMASEQESILRLQVDNMAARLEDLALADEKFRVERHDFRHKMKAISALAEKGRTEELNSLIWEYSENLNKTKIKRYCKNHVLDAALSAYIARAEAKGIKVNVSLSFPDILSVSDTAFATALANAIENAIHACEKLPIEKRFIEIKVLDKPKFMVMIKNSFDGNVEFAEDGVPQSREENHGFGTRSIVSFCEMNNAFYEFKANGNEFILRMVF